MSKNEEVIKLKRSTLIIIIALAVIIVAGFFAYTYGYKYLVEDSDSVLDAIELQVIAIDVDCQKCVDIDVALSIIRDAPEVTLTKERTVDFDSDKGRSLIKKYGIEKLPAFIFVGDIDKLPAENFIIKDNVAILEPILPPYVDVETEEIKGIVDVIYLVDESCEDCYDPKSIKDLLENTFLVPFDVEETIDISTSKGKELVRTYSIAQVPTVILSEQAKYHPVLVQMWSELGVVNDGKYIFTSIDDLSGVKYKDLLKDEIIETEEQEEE